MTPRALRRDSAWRRWQQEGLSGDERAIVDDIPPGVQEAKAALWQAELNVLSARTTRKRHKRSAAACELRYCTRVYLRAESGKFILPFLLQ